MYDVNSKHADDFINHEEILETLAYADENKNNMKLIDAIIEKAKKRKEGFILGACRQGICFIPVILIFPFIWGLNGILYAQPIADVLSALITVFMAIPLHKSLTIAEQKMKTTSIPCDRQ